MSFTYHLLPLLDDSGNKTGDQTNRIQRKEDKAIIPFDDRNTSYQEYLAWLAAGNTPDPSS